MQPHKTCWECGNEYRNSKKKEYRFLCDNCYRKCFVPLLKHYSHSYIEAHYDRLVVKAGLRGKPLTAYQFDSLVDCLSFGGSETAMV